MKNFQATCPDGWKSKTVQADSADDAANMVQEELAMHLKETHQMDLPTDPEEQHKAVVDHMEEIA